MTDGDRFGASLPSKAASASWKSPADTPEIQNGQKGIQAAGPPRPPIPVTQLDPAHRDRADPSLEHAFRAMTVPNQAVTPVRQPDIPH